MKRWVEICGSLECGGLLMVAAALCFGANGVYFVLDGLPELAAEAVVRCCGVSRPGPFVFCDGDRLVVCFVARIPFVRSPTPYFEREQWGALQQEEGGGDVLSAGVDAVRGSRKRRRSGS